MMKFIKWFFIIAVIAGFTVFATANRQPVRISFFPFPYVMETPGFLLATLCFALGAITGWLVNAMKLWQSRQRFRAERQRVQALENEVKMLRMEQSAQAVPPPALEKPA
ncbi:MAG: LapA family protein [Pseudomonadota bacterium]|nr:LapA family protein [Pseudomonadota bacterium]